MGTAYVIATFSNLLFCTNITHNFFRITDVEMRPVTIVRGKYLMCHISHPPPTKSGATPPNPRFSGPGI